MGSCMIFKSCLACAQAEGTDNRNRDDRERGPRPAVSRAVPRDALAVSVDNVEGGCTLPQETGRR